jgi:ABC-type cobalamin/Fe3+-siderophores transport system ATPase subunit
VPDDKLATFLVSTLIDKMKSKIILPNKTGQGDSVTVESENNFVIIGGNGAGKTRLGTWIEQQIQNNVNIHRILAQRALNLPESAEIKTHEQAEKDLIYGRHDVHASVARKIHDRYGNSPETFLLNDYAFLLSNLFAKATKRDADHAKETKAKQVYIPVPDSVSDLIIKLWADIMPQREIIFEDSKVTVKKAGIPEYHGKDMSDGERVTLYLIGQCLCVPDNSVIIIDEPEIHLHKSLMTRLWNKIEEACPNKSFIYITHDLDFAASRKGAFKIWIKNYNGKTWEWDEVPEVEAFPENLTIEIIGNRKNIIFIEGENASHDIILYQTVFPDFLIIPRGGCSKVIESTKAMVSSPVLHHLHAYGIIDADYRTNEEITALEKSRIYTISVAEIENLFCVEQIVRIVASHLAFDPNQKVKEVTNFVIDSLQKEFDIQVTNHAEREIQFKLNVFTKLAHTEQGLKDGFAGMISRIDIAAIYTSSKVLFETAITENNLEKALRIYNRKKLSDRISPIFGLKEGEYVSLVTRLLKGTQKEEIIKAFKTYLPILK